MTKVQKFFITLRDFFIFKNKNIEKSWNRDLSIPAIFDPWQGVYPYAPPAKPLNLTNLSRRLAMVSGWWGWMPKPVPGHLGTRTKTMFFVPDPTDPPMPCGGFQRWLAFFPSRLLAMARILCRGERNSWLLVLRP